MSTVDVLVHPEDMRAALRADVARGLTADPVELPPKWFYDHRGSVLFDEITRLPEYYPTRCERSILAARADEIAKLTSPDTLVELGSGTSEKTRLLLAALDGTLTRFVPFDVSETMLREAAAAVEREHPRITVHAIAGDFERHLSALPGGGVRLIAFLGGTIGNLRPDQRAKLLADLAAGMGPRDALLLGTDLVKDVDRLLAAYDDAAGVTADFNRNVLRVVNRELDADFDVDAYEHVARWNPQRRWIEMWLRAATPQRVKVRALDLSVTVTEMRTEISAKFTRETVGAELAAAGLTLAEWWTDESGDFALSLARRG